MSTNTVLIGGVEVKPHPQIADAVAVLLKWKDAEVFLRDVRASELDLVNYLTQRVLLTRGWANQVAKEIESNRRPLNTYERVDARLLYAVIVKVLRSNIPYENWRPPRMQKFGEGKCIADPTVKKVYEEAKGFIGFLVNTKYLEPLNFVQIPEEVQIVPEIPEEVWTMPEIPEEVWNVPKKIRISSRGAIQNYVERAKYILANDNEDAIILQGVGHAISRTVYVAERIKKVFCLHQDTMIGTLVDPVDSGRVSMISITLSMKEFNNNSSPGYQPPTQDDGEGYGLKSSKQIQNAPAPRQDDGEGYGLKSSNQIQKAPASRQGRVGPRGSNINYQERGGCRG